MGTQVEHGRGPGTTTGAGTAALGLVPAAYRPEGRPAAVDGERARRAADVVISTVALIALSPFLLAIAIAIRLDSGGPSLYRQTRVGRDGEWFTMLKFRTMQPGSHPQQELLRPYSDWPGGLFKVRDDPRRTRFGAFLRRHCLDELPQLWNVARGDMSLVGPRPLTPKEDHLAARALEARHDVRPGITGYWQVFRSASSSLEELVVLDGIYLRSRSLRRDLRLILRTFRFVASRANV